MNSAQALKAGAMRVTTGSDWPKGTNKAGRVVVAVAAAAAGRRRRRRRRRMKTKDDS
jgi:hypothetical protein